MKADLAVGVSYKLSQWTHHSTDLTLCRLDFDYLNNLPHLILDVDDDFKNDHIKQEDFINRVCFDSNLFCRCWQLSDFYFLTSSLFLPAGQRLPHHAVDSSTNHKPGCKLQLQLTVFHVLVLNICSSVNLIYVLYFLIFCRYLSVKVSCLFVCVDMCINTMYLLELYELANIYSSGWITSLMKTWCLTSVTATCQWRHRNGPKSQHAMFFSVDQCESVKSNICFSAECFLTCSETH